MRVGKVGLEIVLLLLVMTNVLRKRPRRISKRFNC